MRSLRPVRVLSALLAALLLTATLTACGESADSSSGAPGSVGVLADGFPAGTLAYGEAVVRPDGALADNAKSVLGKLLGKAPDQVGTEIVKQLDEDSGEGLGWAEVKQFLGKRAAIGLLGVSGAVKDSSLDGLDGEAGFIIEITDRGKAEAALAKGKAVTKGTTGGTTYYEDDGTFAAVQGKRVVGGTSLAALKRMLAAGAGGAHLSDDDRFRKAAGMAAADPLVFVYADVRGLLDRIDALATGEAKTALATVRKTLGEQRPLVAGTATFTRRAIAVDIAQTGGKTGAGDGKANTAVAGVPADAWLALGVSDAGKVLTDVLNQIKGLGTVDGTDINAQIEHAEQQLGINLEQDLFSWMGDLAVFARGTAEQTLGGAVIVQSLDRDKSAKAIGEIRSVLGQAGAPAKPVTVDGAKGIAIDAGGMTILMVQQGDKVAIALGEQAARDGLAPKGTLGDSAAFKAASEELGGLNPTFYLDMRQLVKVAKENGDLDAESERVLNALEAVVAGTEAEGDVQHVKAALLVR